ncbi:MAG: hypothetical protein L0332_33540 [Chloroflexi bacterium]|nr:hypothetical protein [Chloroflexota bacterium]
MSAVTPSLDMNQPQGYPLKFILICIVTFLGGLSILFASHSPPTAHIPLQLPSNLPTPNCQELGLEDCRWQAWRSEDGQEVRVELKAGEDTTVARVELSEETFADIPELAQTGISRGWFGYIEVVKGFQGHGLGRLAWYVGDLALKAHVGGGFYRAFIDKTGWGLQLISGGTEIVYSNTAEGIWVYYVR